MTTITPVPFPATQWPADEYISKKSRNHTVRIGQADLQHLYTSGCVEVDGLPQCNLANEIHPLFAKNRFQNFTTAQYDAILSAVTLASRFITENNYTEFWKRIYYGRANAGPGGTQPHETIRLPSRRDRELKPEDTRTALINLSTRVTFFCWDEVYDQARPQTCGEAFPDDDNWRCRNYQARHQSGKTCGTCRYCIARKDFRCSICARTDYDNRKCTIAVLRRLLNDRGVVNAHLTRKAQLVSALEDHDPVAYGLVPVQYITMDAQRAHLPVGLRNEVMTHIEEIIAGNRWTPSEEDRFQFGLAVTLVHETAHQFWLDRSRRCWECGETGACPWWSPSDRLKRFRLDPELGDSWEVWAFGSRRAAPGKIHEVPGQPVPSVYQRLQWLCIYQTTTSGPSGLAGNLAYEFILPVAYYNSWFQEATWLNIRTFGRIAGRPRFDNAVVLRRIARRLTTHKNIDLWKGEITGYTYQQLLAAGGFYNAPDRFLHGPRGTAERLDARDAKLARAREKRRATRKAADRKREMRTRFK